MQGFNMGRYLPPHLHGLTTSNRATNTVPKSSKQNTDGSTTVRFECPFPIWCTTCLPETIIAQGVRFNAHKLKIGNYYTTPIWSFRIKHSVCGGWIEVRTDPRNAEYVVYEGGRKRDLGGDRGEDGEIVSVAQVTVGEMESVLGRLEKKRGDETVVEKEKVRIQELKRRSERDWGDPYELNKRIRREFRVGRRLRQDDERTGQGLKEKFGLGVDVVAAVEEDGVRARLVDFGGRDDGGGVSRGLFEGLKVIGDGGTEKDRGKRGKKSDLVAEKKAALRKDLKANSRPKMDPFWTKDAWQPPVKRRRDDEIGTVTKDNEAIQIHENTRKTLVAYDSD